MILQEWKNNVEEMEEILEKVCYLILSFVIVPVIE